MTLIKFVDFINAYKCGVVNEKFRCLLGHKNEKSLKTTMPFEPVPTDTTFFCMHSHK